MTTPTPLPALAVVPANAPLGDPIVAGLFTGLLGTLGSWSLRVVTLINSMISGQIPGTATNDAATAGNVGEYIFSEVTFASRITITTSAVAQNLTSIVVTPGDWEIYGNVYFSAAATGSFYQAGISQNSATVPDASRVALDATALDAGIVVPERRISLTTNTTFYMVVSANFSAGNPAACGSLRARRAR